MCVTSPPPPRFPSSVLASPPSVPSTQRPRLYIQPGRDRRPLWPFWCPHSQPLTSEVVVRAGRGFSNVLIYISSKISPHSLKVRGGAAELILSDEHSKTPLHWLTELSQTVAPRKASWRNAGKNRTFYLLLFFPRKHRQKQMTNNSIFGLWMRKRCFCISFPMYECVGTYFTQVGCGCVCVCVCLCVLSSVMNAVLTQVRRLQGKKQNHEKAFSYQVKSHGRLTEHSFYHHMARVQTQLVKYALSSCT